MRSDDGDVDHGALESQSVDQSAESQNNVGRNDKPKGVRGNVFDLKASARDAHDREEQRDQESEMMGLLGSKEPTAASWSKSRSHPDLSSVASSVAALKIRSHHKRSNRFLEWDNSPGSASQYY